MDYKPTVTIGVSAYNAEKHIRMLLNSLLIQEQIHFNLEEIIVISDASDDRTVVETKSIDSPLVKLVNNSEKEGVSMYLNKIINLAKGEVVIFIEADILPSHSKVIDELILPFCEKYIKVAMTVGVSCPLSTHSMFEEIKIFEDINTTKNLSKWKKGKNIYLVNGRPAIAISREFAMKIFIPDNVLPEYYLYLKLREHNFYLNKRKNATFFVRNPRSFAGYLKQFKYHLEGTKTLQYYFAKSLYRRETHYPLSLAYKGVMRMLLTRPLLFVCLALIKIAALMVLNYRLISARFFNPVLSSGTFSRLS